MKFITEEFRDHLIGLGLVRMQNVAGDEPVVYVQSTKVPEPLGPSDNPSGVAKVFLCNGQPWIVPELEEFRATPVVEVHVRSKTPQEGERISRQIKRAMSGLRNAPLGSIDTVSQIRATGGPFPVSLPETEAEGFIYVTYYSIDVRESALD